jgi:hypothetical protein
MVIFDGGAADINGILVSGSTLYFSAGHGIFKVPITGGQPMLLGVAQKNGVPHALDIDSTSIYYPTADHWDVEFMDLVTGLTVDPDSRIASSQVGLLLDTITVRGGEVYWAKQANLLVGMVGGAPQSQKTVATITCLQSAEATCEIGSITAFVIGSTDAYFASSDAAAIERAPLALADGGAANFIIALDQKATTSIALDSARVYWAADCAILSAPQ